MSFFCLLPGVSTSVSVASAVAASSLPWDAIPVQHVDRAEYFYIRCSVDKKHHTIHMDDDMPPARVDPQQEKMIKELRQCWELAALSHFYRAVGPALRFPKINAEELERRLLSPLEVDELLVPLLNLHKTPAHEVHAECWNAIRRLHTQQELQNLPFSFDENSSFALLAPQQRLQLLLAVAEARLSSDSEELAALHGADTVQAASLRPERMGNDSDGRVYWYTFPPNPADCYDPHFNLHAAAHTTLTFTASPHRNRRALAPPKYSAMV